MHTHVHMHVYAHLYADRKSQQRRLNASSNVIDAHTYPYIYACTYIYICIYTYVHTLQSERVCRRCVSWCQTNTCITYAPAHALVPRTPVPKCTQHSLPKHAHIYTYIYTHMHTHTYAHIHACESTTLPHTPMPCYWHSQPIHKYTYTYIYICIYMHTYTYQYTHVCIYINTCLYTYILAHIYTHTYNMYVWTHARTPETTMRQWLHEKSNLTPGSYALFPVRCNLALMEVHPQRPAAHLPRSRGTTDEFRTTTTNRSSSHHRDSVPPRLHPLICTGVEPIHPIHAQSGRRPRLDLMRDHTLK